MNGDWKQQLFGHCRTNDEGFIVRRPALHHEYQRQQSYIRGGGCRQRQRSQNRLEAGAYDLDSYHRLLQDVAAQLPFDAVAVELGCGDGRMVQLLLQIGVKRIVAVDFNPHDLQSLWQSLDESQRSYVQPVVSSVSDQPLVEEVADLVILSEVAYALADPAVAYQRVRQWLKPGGLALISNVAPESYLLHAILNQDWHQVRRVARSSRYLDQVGGEPVEVTLFTREQLARLAERSGLEPYQDLAISGAAALLIHSLRQAESVGPEHLELIESVASSGISIPRLHVQVLRRVA